MNQSATLGAATALPAHCVIVSSSPIASHDRRTRDTIAKALT